DPWTAKDVAKKVNTETDRLTQERENSADKTVLKDNLESTRSRIDQAIKDARTLRDMANERASLYDERTRALKNGETAKVKALDSKIEELNNKEQQLRSSRIVSELEARQKAGALTAEDAVKLARARLGLAQANHALDVRTANRWMRAGMMADASA